MRESLLFVHNTRVGAGLRRKDKDRLCGQSRKRVRHRGSARARAQVGPTPVAALMFALDAFSRYRATRISLSGRRGKPDPMRQRAIVIPDKAERVYNFHRKHPRGIVGHACGRCTGSSEQDWSSSSRPEVSLTEIRMFSQLHNFLNEGELLADDHNRDFYSSAWKWPAPTPFDLAA